MSSEMTLVPDEFRERVIDGEGDGNGHGGPHDGHGAHDIHLPPPSIAPIVVAGGALFLLLTLLNPLWLLVAVPVLGYGVWRMIHFPEFDISAKWLPAMDHRKLAMWAFLASEVMFFGSLIGGYLYFKLKGGFGFEEAEAILSLPLATVGTSVLIVSSFAVVMALEALQSNDMRVFRNWMIAVLVLGAGFLTIQAFEWYELMDHGVTTSDLFGTAFFITTGFHGLHVLGGVVWIALLLFRALVQKVYSAENSLGVELFGLYWHFVDVVWIALFTVIYLVR
jgi:heme/copper-type cytochrome/quinol oxidase subunit 3